MRLNRIKDGPSGFPDSWLLIGTRDKGGKLTFCQISKKKTSALYKSVKI